MKKNAFLSILVCLCMVLGLVMVPAVRANAATYECGTVADMNGYVIPAANGYNNYHFTATEAGAVEITLDGYASVENYTTGADYTQIWAGETAKVTVAEGDVVRIQTYDSEADITVTANFIPAGGNEGGDEGGEDVIDTSVLDGVYNVNFIMNGIYVLTFNNGTLTIEDNNNGKAAGTYSYTVDADGNITVVSEINIVIGKTADGYTFSCDYLPNAQPLVKVANLPENGGDEGESEISYEEVEVNTGNAITIDASWKPVTYQYTATEAGTFTVTSGMVIMAAELELYVKGDESSMISGSLAANETMSIDVEAGDVIIINFPTGYLLAGFTFEASEGGEEGGEGSEGDGSYSNPFVLPNLDPLPYVAGTDVYYIWTADKTGTLTATLSAEFAFSMENQTSYVPANTTDWINFSLFVEEGDVVFMNLYGGDVDATVTFSFVEGIPLGHEKNPATGNLLEGVVVDVPIGSSYFFTWTPETTENLAVTFMGAGFSAPSCLIVNGVEVYFDDYGKAVIEAVAGEELLIGVVAPMWGRGNLTGTLIGAPMGPLGTEGNPEVLESLENVVVDTEEEYYYYLYTAYDEGDLHFVLTGEGAEMTVIITDYEGNTLTFTSKDGELVVPVCYETITIVVNGATESFSGEMVYPEGSESNPIIWTELPAELVLEMYSETYFQYTATENISVVVTFVSGIGYWHDANNYDRLDAVYNEDWDPVGYTFNMLAGETLLLYTTGGAEGITATFEVSAYEPPVGSQGNPENIESIEEVVLGYEDSEVYYSWTAPSNGTLTITMETSWAYGYSMTINGETVMVDDVIELTLAEGETVVLMIEVYPSASSEGNFTVRGVFTPASEGGEGGNNNPPTGDYAVLFSVVAAVSLMGLAVVVSKKREF